MRIGVTGCAGYIGSRLVQHLLANPKHRQDKIVGVDLLLYGGDALLGVIGDRRFEFHQGALVRGKTWTRGRLRGGVLDDSGWAPLLDCHVIIHAAGLIGPACEKDPALADALNLDPLRELANIVAAGGDAHHSPFLVNLSSCSVYGPTTFPVREEWEAKGASIYAKQKIVSERIVNQAKLGVNLRLGTLFGVSPRLRMDLLINQAARVASVHHEPTMDGPMPFFRKPHEFRPFLSMPDLLNAIDNVLDAQWDVLTGHTLNIVTKNLLQKDVCELFGKGNLTIAERTDADMGVSGYQCSGELAREVLGFTGDEMSIGRTVHDLQKAIPLLKDPWADKWRNA